MEFADNNPLELLMACSSFSELHQKPLDPSFLYDDPLTVFMPLSPPLSTYSLSPPPQCPIYTTKTGAPAPSVHIKAEPHEEEEQQQQPKNIKKPRRRIYDLPYATNLLNLDLSTHTRGSSSSSSSSSTCAQRQRPQANSQHMTFQYSAISASSPSSIPVSLEAAAEGVPGVSSYKCNFKNCDKTFTRPYNLKSHLRTHTLERPYPCHLCKKRFARQHDRNRHTKLHYGIKPYVCHVCNKPFARQDALNRHQRSDNPEASCATVGHRRDRSKRMRRDYSEEQHV